MYSKRRKVLEMNIAIQGPQIGTFGLIRKVNNTVKVTLKKECEDCGADISVTAAQMKSKMFPDTAHVATYKAGVCNNCSWERVHADGKDHFMDSKESILNGLTEAQYQDKHGQAWNE